MKTIEPIETIDIDLDDLERVIGGVGTGTPTSRGIDFDKGPGGAIDQTKERAATCRALVKAAGPNPKPGSDEWALAKAGRACWGSIGPS
jgi:hypothetical protein